jgi:hypothetical protein
MLIITQHFIFKKGDIYMIVIGFVLIFASAIFSIIMYLISSWTENIIIFDCFVLGIITGVAVHNKFQIHPAFCLLIGIATVIVLGAIQYGTKIGFWLISILMSLGWGIVMVIIAMIFSLQDDIWEYVIWGLGFIVSLVLHLDDRRRHHPNGSAS